MTKFVEAVKFVSNNSFPVDWMKEGVNVETKYVVEFIDNEHDLNIINSGNHPAPWELYEKIETDNLENAIELFMMRYMNDKLYDVRLFEQIVVNGEPVRVVTVDTFNYIDYLRTQEQRILDKENRRLKESNEFAQERIEMFEKYLSQFRGGMKNFNEFRYKQEEAV